MLLIFNYIPVPNFINNVHLRIQFSLSSDVGHIMFHEVSRSVNKNPHCCVILIRDYVKGQIHKVQIYCCLFWAEANHPNGIQTIAQLSPAQ